MAWRRISWKEKTDFDPNQKRDNGTSCNENASDSTSLKSILGGQYRLDGPHEMTTKPKPLRPMKAIRSNCLECSSSPKAVAYCPCDGFNSTRCEFWPYRFGCRPETARVEYGDAMLTPELMPGPEVELDSLPKNPRDYQPNMVEKAEEGHERADSQQGTVGLV